MAIFHPDADKRGWLTVQQYSANSPLEVRLSNKFYDELTAAAKKVSEGRGWFEEFTTTWPTADAFRKGMLNLGFDEKSAESFYKNFYGSEELYNNPERAREAIDRALNAAAGKGGKFERELQAQFRGFLASQTKSQDRVGGENAGVRVVTTQTLDANGNVVAKSPENNDEAKGGNKPEAVVTPGAVVEANAGAVERKPTNTPETKRGVRAERGLQELGERMPGNGGAPAVTERGVGAGDGAAPAVAERRDFNAERKRALEALGGYTGPKTQAALLKSAKEYIKLTAERGKIPKGSELEEKAKALSASELAAIGDLGPARAAALHYIGSKNSYKNKPVGEVVAALKKGDVGATGLSEDLKLLQQRTRQSDRQFDSMLRRIDRLDRFEDSNVTTNISAGDIFKNYESRVAKLDGDEPGGAAKTAVPSGGPSNKISAAAPGRQ